MSASSSKLAVAMGGGGARAAYQVGVLRALARQHPDLEIPFLTGISAGAINAAHMANGTASFPDKVEALVALWSGLECKDVFEVSGPALFGRAARVAARLVIGARQSKTPLLHFTPKLSNELIRE